MLNATFSNISAISWRPVLAVKEAGYPDRAIDHGQAAGKLYNWRIRVECTLLCNLQNPARTHAVLVRGLYQLLGNPTTELIEPPGPLTINQRRTDNPMDKSKRTKEETVKYYSENKNLSTQLIKQSQPQTTPSIPQPT